MYWYVESSNRHEGVSVLSRRREARSTETEVFLLAKLFIHRAEMAQYRVGLKHRIEICATTRLEEVEQTKSNAVTVSPTPPTPPPSSAARPRHPPHIQASEHDRCHHYTRHITSYTSIYHTRTTDMSSAKDIPLPIPLLNHYLARRHQSTATAHERNVALLEAANIRQLQPVPVAWLACSGLTPNPPPPVIQFSSAAHQQMLTNDSEFFATATMTAAEFTLLHAHIRQKLLMPRTHPTSTSAHSHPMPTELTTEDQLLLWLCHGCGDRTARLCVDFNHLHRTTIHRYIDHVSECIIEALEDMVQWPSSVEREQLHGRMSVCTGAVAVLDGTHCPTQAPSHLTHTYYSGYKCKHTQNYLVCVNYLGFVLSIEGPYVGRENDRADYKQSDLFHNYAQYTSDGEYILADGGFVNGPNLLVPIHQTVIDKQTDSDGREGMMAYNKEFTSNRLIVEDVFGWIKDSVCVLNTAWPQSLERQALVFKAACRVHNFKRLLRMEYAMRNAADDVNQSQ